MVAERGEPDSKMYENKGLVYCLLDEHGVRIGVPIKASSIYSSPILKSLEKKFISNATVRKPFGLRLKYLLDKAIKESKSMDDLLEALHRQGIRIVIRENVNGKVYGITFIDNATRVVFKGSDLGKTYGAAAFMARINAVEKLDQSSVLVERAAKAYIESTAQTRGSFLAAEQPIFHRLTDIAFSGRYDESGTDPFRRKKKKKFQIES